MKLCKKTLEKLREIINGDNIANYRTGSRLVEFFNELGAHDTYGQGFPSRYAYTDEKLQSINGTPELDKCIRNAFAVIDFVGRIKELDDLISGFNKYMAFDKWQVIRDNDIITFKKLDRVILEANEVNVETGEDEFLKQIFKVDINSMGLELAISDIIEQRLSEIEICIKNNASLASILLIGSVMEGILLGTALMFPLQFNKSLSAPKDRNTEKVKKFQDWTLNNFIDVSSEIGILKQDVKKFSHVVRDFRNYIHPYEQMGSKFSPDKQTALICYQVLKAAINQIGTFRKGQ